MVSRLRRDIGSSPPASSRIAVLTAGTGATLTHGELEERSARLAGLFRAHGVERGDVLALVMENRSEFFVAAWAGMRCGMYVAPADPRLAAPELAAALQRADPAAVITSPKHARSTRAALEGLGPRVVLEVGGELDAAIAGATPIVPGAESLGARMIFSSGSTGRPKAIRLPLPDAHPSEASARLGVLFDHFGFGDDSVLVSPAPLYHAAPFSFTQGVQVAGGTTVLHERFDAEAVLASMAEHQATHVLLVPTMLRRLLNLPETVRAAADLTALRVAITGAAPCDPALKEAILDWWGPVLHEYYGASEGYGLTHMSPAGMRERPASVGRALKGTIHITGPDGEDLDPGETGRVWFSGTGTPITYVGQPELSAATRGEGDRQSIGDRGYLDEAGYLFLTGRESELIITGGINVEPEQVELALESHPAVADVAVLGVPDDDLGERVVALVVPAGAGDDLRSVLLEHAALRVGRAKLPREILAVEALPRMENGKIARRRLAELYARTARG